MHERRERLSRPTSPKRGVGHSAFSRTPRSYFDAGIAIGFTLPQSGPL